MPAFPVGLVAYYKFEESKVNGGPVADSSGSGNGGVYAISAAPTGASSTTDIAGYSGQGVYMNVAQAYPNNDGPSFNEISVAGLIGLGGYSQTFAVDMRVKIGSLDVTYNRGLIGVGTAISGVLGWGIYTNPSGQLGFVLGSGGGNGGLNNPSASLLTPTAVVPNTDWMRVLCSYDAVTHVAKIYIDNVLKTSKTVPATFGPASQPLYIGGCYLEFVVGAGSFKHCKDTSFDELKIYTYVAPPSRAVIINTSIGRDGRVT